MAVVGVVTTVCVTTDVGSGSVRKTILRSLPSLKILFYVNIPKRIVARKLACGFPVLESIELFARNITTIVFVCAVTFDQTDVIVFPHHLEKKIKMIIFK
jgi:hypothetical protein